MLYVPLYIYEIHVMSLILPSAPFVVEAGLVFFLAIGHNLFVNSLRRAVMVGAKYPRGI